MTAVDWEQWRGNIAAVDVKRTFVYSVTVIIILGSGPAMLLAIGHVLVRIRARHIPCVTHCPSVTPE